MRGQQVISLNNIVFVKVFQKFCALCLLCSSQHGYFLGYFKITQDKILYLILYVPQIFKGIDLFL